MTVHQELRSTETVTIANGASLSDAVDISGAAVVGIVMPAVWTAAELTFQASADGTAYNNLYSDDDSEYSVQAAAARYIHIVPSEFAGIRYLKVRSGTSGTPVNQGAERTVTLVVRPV